MGQRDLIIGVLVFIVFVLLSQRAVSQYRCEEGEIQKENKCESDSYKTKWWAFWESPKCKRGELQSDYTCLASMIWDAVSPGAASSPQTAAPAGPNVDILNHLNGMIDFVERNFLSSSTGQGQELTVNIGVAEACPIQPGAKVNVGVTVKQSFDQQVMRDFQNMLNEFYNALINTHGTADEQAAARNPLNQAIQNVVTTENLMSIATSTINYQTGNLNIAVCKFDAPLKLDAHFPASAIVNNILWKIGDEVSNLMGKPGDNKMAPKNDWAKFDVQNPVQSEGVKKVM